MAWMISGRLPSAFLMIIILMCMQEPSGASVNITTCVTIGEDSSAYVSCGNGQIHIVSAYLGRTQNLLQCQSSNQPSSTDCTFRRELMTLLFKEQCNTRVGTCRPKFVYPSDASLDECYAETGAGYVHYKFKCIRDTAATNNEINPLESDGLTHIFATNGGVHLQSTGYPAMADFNGNFTCHINLQTNIRLTVDINDLSYQNFPYCIHWEAGMRMDICANNTGIFTPLTLMTSTKMTIRPIINPRSFGRFWFVLRAEASGSDEDSGQSALSITCGDIDNSVIGPGDYAAPISEDPGSVTSADNPEVEESNPSDEDGDGLTGIIAGVTVGIICIIVFVIILVSYRYHQQHRSKYHGQMSNEDPKQETPVRTDAFGEMERINSLYSPDKPAETVTSFIPNTHQTRMNNKESSRQNPTAPSRPISNQYEEVNAQDGDIKLKSFSGSPSPEYFIYDTGACAETTDNAKNFKRESKLECKMNDEDVIDDSNHVYAEIDDGGLYEETRVREPYYEAQFAERAHYKTSPVKRWEKTTIDPDHYDNVSHLYTEPIKRSTSETELNENTIYMEPDV